MNSITQEQIAANADRLIEMGEAAWRRSRKLKESPLSLEQKEQLLQLEEMFNEHCFTDTEKQYAIK